MTEKEVLTINIFIFIPFFVQKNQKFVNIEISQQYNFNGKFNIPVHIIILKMN